MTDAAPIVDAHQHFWDLRANYHPWLCDEPPIPFRYGDYSRAAAALPAGRLSSPTRAASRSSKTVYVETEWDPSDPVGEMRWVERCGARPGFPR